MQGIRVGSGRPRSRRASAWCASFVVASCWTSSCRAPVGDPRAEERVAAAVGAAERVASRSGAMPLDEPAFAGESLTLPEVLRRAWSGSAELQVALSEVRSAWADASRARQLPNPLLDVSWRWPLDGGASVLEAGLPFDLGALLARPRGELVADERLRASVLHAIETALDVSFGARAAWTEARAFDRRVERLGEQRALLRGWADTAEARLRSGEGSRLDVLSFEARVRELDVAIDEARSRRRATRFALAAWMGSPSSACEWNLVDDATAHDADQVTVDEAAAVGLALERSPELAALRHEILALEHEARAVGLFEREPSAVGLVAEHERDLSIGPAVQVPLPIFDDGSARRARLEADLSAARHRWTARARAWITEVRTAREARASAIARVASARDSWLPSLRSHRDLAVSLYRAGSTDATALLAAQQEVQRGEMRLVELEEAAEFAHARLQRALGAVDALPASPGTPSNTNTETQD